MKLEIKNWGVHLSRDEKTNNDVVTQLGAAAVAADHWEKMTFSEGDSGPTTKNQKARKDENSHAQPPPSGPITPTTQAQSQSIAMDIPDYVPDHLSEDMSVSSLGSGDERDLRDSSSSSNYPNRSIFRNYWKGDGDEKGSTKHENSSATRTLETATMSLSRYSNELSGLERYAHEMTILPEWSSYLQEECGDQKLLAKNLCDKTGYEEILKINEAGRTARPSAALLKDSKGCDGEDGPCTPNNPLHTASSYASNRRRLFTRKYFSTKPTLPSYGYSYSTNNKGKSPLPFLLSNRKMLRSSLRDRTASLSEATGTTADESLLSSQSRPSVSFDPQVSIHEFNKPYEQYISDGWSKNFA